jgi:hypothetical protein
MSKARTWIALTGLLAVLAPAATLAAGRIDWDPGPPSVLFRHVTWPAATGAAPQAQLLADLNGRLRSLAKADTALYAVFLDRAADVQTLAAVLRDHGSPARWRARAYDPEVSAFLTTQAAVEPIRLQTNGSLTIHADEGRFPRKDFVAVVNGAGDILGARPVWQSARDYPGDSEPSAEAVKSAPSPRRR